MNKVNNTADLQAAITLLEQTQQANAVALKLQLESTYQLLKPANLIKSALHHIVASPAIKQGLVNNAIGFGTGYLSKKIIVQSSHNPIVQTIGSVAQMVVSAIAYKHVSTIKIFTEVLFKTIFSTPKNEATKNTVQ
jgi:hypothetical protein